MTFVNGQTLSAEDLNAAFATAEKANNRQIAISNQSSDEQYPSAKATYDFVNTQITTAIKNLVVGGPGDAIGGIYDPGLWSAADAVTDGGVWG